MSIVTYIPGRNGFLISNSNEKVQRSIGLPPAPYPVNGYELVYPNDQDGTVSWIAMHEAGRFAVLLKHNTDLLNETKKAFAIPFTNVPQLYS